MQKIEVVYSYYSIEKLYCVLVWKIIVDQIPLDELLALSKQLNKFAQDDVSTIGIDVFFNEDNSIVIYPDGDVVNILCFGQCEKDEKTLKRLRDCGKEVKSFNEFNEKF